MSSSRESSVKSDSSEPRIEKAKELDEPSPSRTSVAASSSGEERNSVAVSAFVFMMGTLASRVLGLVRDMMTARYFPNDVRDAFFYAFRLPNLFRRLLGEGALSISFIPIFVEILSGKDSTGQDEVEKRARSLVAGVFSVLLVTTISLSLLATLFMEDILRILLSGEAYMAVPGKFEMTVRLGRIMFSFLILVSLYAFFMAILNSLKKFAMTALAPCFFNVAMIGAALVSPRLAAPEDVLAWAVVVGGFLQMIVLVPGVLKAGYFPRFSWQWNSPEIGRVFRAILPSLLGMSVMQLTALVNMHFTSYLQSGAQSYLYLADRILELPLSMFVVSVGSALLPTLARYWSEGDKEAMGDTINHYLRLIVFVSFPAALGMFILAQPIVEVLFLGREFKYADALATAQIIRIYSFSVLISAGVRILAQGFFAIQNTWFPAVASAVALVSHVIFAYTLTNAFGLNGLAVASVASAAVNLTMLVTGYNAWVGSLRLRAFLLSFLKFSVCGAVMAVVLQAHESVQRAVSGFWGARAVSLLLMVGLGGMVYMFCAHVLRIREYRETVATFAEKIGNRLRRRRA